MKLLPNRYTRPVSIALAVAAGFAVTYLASADAGPNPRSGQCGPGAAIGAEKSFGTAMAADIRFVATNVTGAVIPDSGHWLMEEQPAATIAVIRDFLETK
jgi:pimeloyl-ACP methyl ester carboxylesterase